MVSTGRPRTKEVILTREMIDAGAKELVIDNSTDDCDVVRAILSAALEAGRYEVKEIA